MQIIILWFSHRDILNPKAGGAERTTFELGRRLVLRGHKLVWVSVSWSGSHSQIELEGIDIIRIPNNFAIHLEVPRMIKSVDPDVIVDDLAHAIPWASELLSSKKGTVFFRHMHRRTLKGQVPFFLRILFSIIELIYPFIYRNWEFVTESNSSVTDLILLGIKPSHVKRIPPGVDLELFNFNQKTIEPTLIYFGGFRDYKRPWEVLYSLKKLLEIRTDITLFMLGDGPSLIYTKEVANSLDLVDHIQFLGKVTQKRMAELVSKAWVNVHTSVAEGFCLSILESSASGTFTVAYNVPGVRDIIYNGENGILVENSNREALTDAIGSVINNGPNKYKEGSRTVALQFSWEKATDGWEDHLTSILRTK